MSIPWTCPPAWPVFLFGFLVGLPLGLWVGYRWRGWRVFVMTVVSGWSQTGGDT